MNTDTKGEIQAKATLVGVIYGGAAFHYGIELWIILVVQMILIVLFTTTRAYSRLWTYTWNAHRRLLGKTR